MKILKLQQPISQQTQQRIAWLVLALAMLAYAIFMSYQSVLRYETFKSTAFDLGNMDQVVWNTLHGRFFALTNQGEDWFGPPTRLAIHFEPILLPLSLLYLIYSDPRTLLIFQTLALVAGALPVFLLARKYLPRWPLLASAMALAYLLSPALIGINIFDFHPISLATPLLLYALLALEHKRYKWFLLACLLAAACKEDVPIAIALLGVMLIWKYKLPRLGTLLIVGGSLWFALAFFVIIPHFFPGAQHNNFWYRYEALGSTPGAAAINILLHPWLLFTTFFTLDRFYYLASLLRSTGFLALLDPIWLLPAAFSVAENTLSTDSLIYSGVYHYNAIIIPFVMLSAIHGLQRAIWFWQTWRGELTQTSSQPVPSLAASPAKLSQAHSAPLLQRISTTYAGLTHAVATHHTFTRSAALLQPRIATIKRVSNSRWQHFGERMQPLAKGIHLSSLQWIISLWLILMIALNLVTMNVQLRWVNWADHTPGSREQHIQKLLDMIPPDASVSASTSLNPHLTERQYITVFPQITYITEKNVKKTVQYIIVDLNSVFPEDKVSTAREITQLSNSKEYRTFHADGVILLIRKSP